MKKRWIMIIGGMLLTVAEVFACTSAIIGASRNPYGRPLLWKHRDTSAIDKKVEFIPGSEGE